MKEIRNFNGDFNFLSNFSPHDIIDKDGVTWKTVEHFYQAMKTTDADERGRIFNAFSPGQAKKIGQEVTLRTDWDTKKFDFMTEAVTLKFLLHKDIKELLISTEGYKLVEGNSWHDNIWGDCDCSKCKNIKGTNLLGQVLMLIRRRYLMESKDIFDDITSQLDRIGIETERPIVHAIFIKDHSGSMGQFTPDGGQRRSDLAKSNFNEQLVKIKRESKEVYTTVTLVEFDDRVYVGGKPIVEVMEGPASTKVSYEVNEVDELTDWWIGGSTSLRDAIGSAIGIGSTLLSDNDQDDQSVLVMILTDGEENSSREWSDEQIKSKIKSLEDSGRWTFTFMGGQLQASDMIASMGFSRGNTRSMSQTTASYSSSSKMSTGGLDKYYNMRKTGALGTKEFFTEDDKWQQKEKDIT